MDGRPSKDEAIVPTWVYIEYPHYRNPRLIDLINDMERRLVEAEGERDALRRDGPCATCGSANIEGAFPSLRTHAGMHGHNFVSMRTRLAEAERLVQEYAEDTTLGVAIRGWAQGRHAKRRTK